MDPTGKNSGKTPNVSQFCGKKQKNIQKTSQHGNLPGFPGHKIRFLFSSSQTNEVANADSRSLNVTSQKKKTYNAFMGTFQLLFVFFYVSCVSWMWSRHKYIAKTTVFVLSWLVFRTQKCRWNTLPEKPSSWGFCWATWSHCCSRDL